MGELWGSLLDLIGRSVAFFFDLSGIYGIAIILLTVAISLLLFPLTLKQTRSMRGMQEIQPEVKKLQKEYKDDRETLNQELMALYKEKGVNPAAGCLPILVQMPIWFALFRVLRTPVKIFDRLFLRATGEDVLDASGDRLPEFADLDLGDTAIVDTVLDPATGEPLVGCDPDSFVPSGTGLFDALCDGGERFLGMDLSLAPSRAFAESIVTALPYIIAILVVVATAYYQQRQTMVRSKNSGQEMNPQQQSMQTVMKIFPLFFGFISWSMPAGLVLYFAASQIFRIGQQAVIIRLDEQHEREKEEAAKLGSMKSPNDDEDVGDEEGQDGTGQRKAGGQSVHSSKKKKKGRRRK